MALNVDRFIALNVVALMSEKLDFARMVEPERNVPVPAHQQVRKEFCKTEIIRQMEVEDSHFFGPDTGPWETWRRLAHYVGRSMGRQYHTRRLVHRGQMGVRIWRRA
jgi:hypothetical protein